MDARGYLQRQGWQGDGHSLGVSGNGIKKPLLISYKDNALGIGSRKQKEKQADQWWLKAFDSALKDFGTGNQSTLDQVTKLGVGRGGLYGFFVKGKGLEGTISDDSSIVESIDPITSQPPPAILNMSVPAVAPTPVEVKKSKKRKQADADVATDEVVKVKKSKKDKKDKKETAVQEPEYVNGSRADSLLVEDPPTTTKEENKSEKKSKKRKDKTTPSFVVDTVGTPVEIQLAEKQQKKSKKSKARSDDVSAPIANGASESTNILDSLLDKLPTDATESIVKSENTAEPAEQDAADGTKSTEVILLDLGQIKALQRAVKTLKKHIKAHKNALFKRRQNGDKLAPDGKNFMAATSQHLKRTRAAILRQLDPKAKLDDKIATMTAGVIAQLRKHVHRLLEEGNGELDREQPSIDVRKDLEALVGIMVAKVYAGISKEEKRARKQAKKDAAAAAKKATASVKQASAEPSAATESSTADAVAPAEDDFITLAVAEEAAPDTNGMHPARLAMLNDPTPLPQPTSQPAGPYSFSTRGAGGGSGKRYKGKKGGGNGAGPGGGKKGGKKERQRLGLPRKSGGAPKKGGARKA